MTVVPRMVARGSVFSGFLTSSAGTVADSRPRNAHRVSVAANEIACQWPARLTWFGSNGVKFPLCM